MGAFKKPNEFMREAKEKPEKAKEQASEKKKPKPIPQDP